MKRDFTYIDDIVESLVRVLYKKPSENFNFDRSKPDPSTSWAPHRVFNIGNSNPVQLMDYISALEKECGVISKKVFEPMQEGDVPATSADTSNLEAWINYKPYTNIKDGIKKFVIWYRDFYGI